MPAQQYRILVSGSAPVLYPTDTFFGLLYYNRDEALEIPKRYPYSGEWGKPLSRHLMEREHYPMPGLLDIVWLSVTEGVFYSLMKILPTEQMEQLFSQTDKENGEPLFEHIVVGMAPYGGVAVWTHGDKKSVLVGWYHAQEIEVDMKDFMPLNPTVTLDENCDFYIENDPRVLENLEENGLPPLDLFDKYMQQFYYCYLPVFEHWDEENGEWTEYGEKEVMPVMDYIEESLYDGTHDKLHDGGLMAYHKAGKPQKLALQWHIGKSAYTAYFWFDDKEICKAYDQFYNTDADKESDFIFFLDPEIHKYELALYREKEEEMMEISNTAYQLIVFKNKFECYRSDNYNQERGAWIW